METLVARPRRSIPKQSQRLTFALGASSAFDISGLRTLHAELFRSDRLERLDPPGTIFRDMARIMDGFGRSAACAQRALQARIEIEDLDPGCTGGEGSPASSKASRHPKRPSRVTRRHRID